MSLFHRIKRLVKSDMHAFVEGLEDPKWVLAQAVRDMEEELGKIEADLNLRRSHLAKLKDRIAATEALAATLENDIDFAMGEKREDIAKNLIRKSLAAKKNVEDMTKKSLACEEELVAVDADFRAKKSAYEDIRGRCEVLNLIREDVCSTSGAGASRFTSQDTPVETHLNHQVELEFLKRLQKQKEVSHEPR